MFKKLNRFHQKEIHTTIDEKKEKRGKKSKGVEKKSTRPTMMTMIETKSQTIIMVLLLLMERYFDPGLL